MNHTITEARAEADEAVARGVEWLNEEVPGWTERINLDTLDMAHSHHCILGQVFADSPSGLGGYWYVVMGDYEHDRYPERTRAEQVVGSGTWASTHGFDQSYGHYGYDALAAAWRDALAAS